MSDNLGEYAYPQIYDNENSDPEPELSYYLALAHKIGGKVLELGCGTGRVTIPMAEAGVDISGLDIVPGMLEQARAKAGSLPIQWFEGDIRSFEIGAKFNLIFTTAGSFQHLLDSADHQQALASIRRHLAPDGVFALDVMLPNPDLLEGSGEEIDWFSYTDDQGREVRVSGTDHYDPIRMVKTETAIRRWVDENGQEVTIRAPLSLRFFTVEEMETLLKDNRFEIVEKYGDWDHSPLDASSRQLMMVCCVA